MPCLTRATACGASSNSRLTWAIGPLRCLLQRCAPAASSGARLKAAAAEPTSPGPIYKPRTAALGRHKPISSVSTHSAALCSTLQQQPVPCALAPSRPPRPPELQNAAQRRPTGCEGRPRALGRSTARPRPSRWAAARATKGRWPRADHRCGGGRPFAALQCCAPSSLLPRPPPPHLFAPLHSRAAAERAQAAAKPFAVPLHALSGSTFCCPPLAGLVGIAWPGVRVQRGRGLPAARRLHQPAQDRPGWRPRSRPLDPRHKQPPSNRHTRSQGSDRELPPSCSRRLLLPPAPLV